MQGISAPPNKRPRPQLGEGMQRKQVGRRREEPPTQAQEWKEGGPRVSKGRDPVQPEASHLQGAPAPGCASGMGTPRPPKLGPVLRETGVLGMSFHLLPGLGVFFFTKGVFSVCPATAVRIRMSDGLGSSLQRCWKSPRSAKTDKPRSSVLSITGRGGPLPLN